MAVLSQIRKLSRQLFPTGRAFRIPVNGVLDRLVTGLSQSEVTAYNAALSTFNSMLPDNSSFTTDDATFWERVLGLITSDGVSLSDRKLAIRRKMQHPGSIPARQHYLYQQGQLRAAGFDVYVHENLSRTNPNTFLINVEHGDIQHGDSQHGSPSNEMIANKIDPEGDEDFVPGLSFSNIYFIGGAVLGESADVPEERHLEFRELVLRLKPQNQIAYLFVNFV